MIIKKDKNNYGGELMKITKSQLKQIIKEELRSVIQETGAPGDQGPRQVVPGVRHQYQAKLHRLQNALTNSTLDLYNLYVDTYSNDPALAGLPEDQIKKMAEEAVMATVEGIIEKQGNISGQSDDDLARQGYEEFVADHGPEPGPVKDVVDTIYRTKKLYDDVSR